MIKTDLKKQLRELYGPPAKDFVLVTVPELKFLMFDGMGDPNTAQTYAEALEALYSVSYSLKFASKKELERDYVVSPWKDSGGPTTRRRLSLGREMSGVGR